MILFVKQSGKKAGHLETHNRYILCGFLMKTNDNKYGHVTTSLENDYMNGNNHYPKNMLNAYKYLSEYNTGNSAKESYLRAL